MKIIHKNLAASGRWFKFTIMEQMANIGTDVERVIRHRNRGETRESELALDRALELLDFTIADPKNKKRLKEICRVRYLLIDYFMYDNEHESTDEQWQSYFYQFNYAAALAKGR